VLLQGKLSLQDHSGWTQSCQSIEAPVKHREWITFLFEGVTLQSSLRFIAELLAYLALSIVLCLGVVVVARAIVGDTRTQYFVFGYYIANHNDLVRRIWKRLRIEKADEC
jgi:hypothetical protein